VLSNQCAVQSLDINIPDPRLQKVFALVKKKIPALNAESGALRARKKPSCS